MRKDTPEEIGQIFVGGIIFMVIIMALSFIAGGMSNANGDNYGPGGDNPYESPDYPDYPEDESQFHGRQPGTTAPDTSSSAPIPVDTGG